jgi:signal transduction histidine kinase
MGLLLALDRMARKAAERAGFALEMRLPERLHGVALEVEQHVYRAAEEAVHNVVRHAAAQRVVLALVQQGDTLTLRVQDDGVGFDVQAARAAGAHYGLVGLHERASLLGGTLDVHSAPGAGTAITLTVPAAQAAAAPLPQPGKHEENEA